jgi:hypothetical protein
LLPTTWPTGESIAKKTSAVTSSPCWNPLTNAGAVCSPTVAVPVSTKVPGYGAMAVPLADHEMVEVPAGSQSAWTSIGSATRTTPVSVGGAAAATGAATAVAVSNGSISTAHAFGFEPGGVR